MGLTLVNGNGFENVTAARDADFYEGIFGKVTCVLNVGRRMQTVMNGNAPRVYDGVILTKEGRRIQIDYGDNVDFTIPAGMSGVTAYYIIGFKLTTGSNDTETVEPFVQAVSSPTETIEEKMLKDGNSTVYISLQRVTQNGTANSLGARLIQDANVFNRTPVYTSLADLGLESKDYVASIYNSMADNSVALLTQADLLTLPYSGAVGTVLIIRKTSTSGQVYFLSSNGKQNCQCDIDTNDGDWITLPMPKDIYYQENESIRLYFPTGAYLTNDRTRITVFIPMSRKLRSGRSLAFVGGYATARQNSKYIYGSATTPGEINTESTTFNVVQNGIILNINNIDGAFPNSSNNAPVGIWGYANFIEN